VGQSFKPSLAHQILNLMHPVVISEIVCLACLCKIS